MEDCDVVLGDLTDLSELPHHLGLVVSIKDVVALQDEPAAHYTLHTSTVLTKSVKLLLIM